MPAVHDTYNGAARTLLHYLTEAVDAIDDDSTEILSNYTIEEVDERITSFEKARQVLKLKPNVDFRVVRNLKSDVVVLHDKFSRLVEDINPKHLDALIALNQLFTIAEAWNKEDGFVPDFSDCNQDKWFRGSNITRILRGSCLKIRVARLCLRMRIPVLAFVL